MSEKKRIVLTPTYMKDFRCIGSACEDSCCIGWRVDLDKKTYYKYKNSKSEPLKELFELKVKRKNNNKTDGSYGTIKMQKDNSCPFLDEAKLCKIQLNLGESYLSNTCTFYPRQVNKVDGKFERSATVSCPEIARLALLEPNGIVFEQYKESAENAVFLHRTFDTEGHLLFSKPQRFFWEIRLFSIALLQNRNYSIGDRLILMGIAYKQIEQVKSNMEIPALIESLNKIVEDGSLKPDLANVPSNPQIQMRFAKEMTDKKFTQGITSARYMECLKETLNGIGYYNGELLENILVKYEENYENYLKPYLKEKDYILENYLVNEFFRETLPFGTRKSMWESYVFLCALYGMVKLHMIGMAGHHKSFNDELAIKLIQSFSKIVLHNAQFIKNIIFLIEESGFDTLAYMSILVKD